MQEKRAKNKKIHYSLSTFHFFIVPLHPLFEEKHTV